MYHEVYISRRNQGIYGEYEAAAETGEGGWEDVEHYRDYLESESPSGFVYLLGEDDIPDEELRPLTGDEDPDIRGSVHHSPDYIFLIHVPEYEEIYYSGLSETPEEDEEEVEGD